MKNLILIGMPGAGKSTVGVVLAKQQGYHFVDSDLVIQEQTGLLLHEIIEQQGDDGFRQVETGSMRIWQSSILSLRPAAA